jgi:tetratricopeptide (TPR) repeat protein
MEDVFMKSTRKQIVIAGLVLLLGLPALVMGAPVDKKKAKAKSAAAAVEPSKTDSQATPAVKNDEVWNADNQALVALVKDKKNDEALAKAESMMFYLIGKNLMDGPEAATTYNNLGMIYVSTGKLDKGLESLTKALELRRKIFTDNSIEVAIVWQNLAELYKVQAQSIQNKKLNEELAKAQAALDDLKGKDEETVEAAAAHSKIGIINLSRGQIGAALPHLLKSLQLYAKIKGNDSAEVAAVSQRIAELYQLQAQHIYQMSKGK